jgi:hypothetical protein
MDRACRNYLYNSIHFGIIPSEILPALISTNPEASHGRDKMNPISFGKRRWVFLTTSSTIDRLHEKV